MKGTAIRLGLMAGLAEVLLNGGGWLERAGTPVGTATLFSVASCVVAGAMTWRSAPGVGVLLLGVAAGYTSGWAAGPSIISFLPWALAETVSRGRGRLLTGLPSLFVFVLSVLFVEARAAQFYWAAAASVPIVLEAAWLTWLRRATRETRALVLFLSPLLIGLTLDLVLLVARGTTNLPATLSDTLVWVVSVATGLGAGYLAVVARANGKVLEMRQKTAEDFLDWTEAIFCEEAEELGKSLGVAAKNAIRRMYAPGAELAAEDRVMFRASRPKVRVALTSHARMAATVAVFADRKEISAHDVERAYTAVQSVKAMTRYCPMPYLEAETAA